MTGWFTAGMPTTRRRHQVTETDELAAALDEAAARWPQVAPTRTGQRDTVLRILTDLSVETLQFPEGAAVTLAELRAETVLKMPDCCVLLSALDQQARLASFDDRLVKAAHARGVDVVTT